MNLENFHLKKKFLSNWQTYLGPSDLFLHIHEIFWNKPEGYTSILCDIMRKGSLKDLIEFSVGMNERMLRSLAHFLLRAYKEFSNYTKSSLGSLSPSQIFFDEQGDIKIGPKLDNSTVTQKIGDFGYLRSIFARIRPNTEYETQEDEDLFEIGLLLFYCAVGEIQLFDGNSASGELRKNQRAEETKETIFLRSDTNFFLNDRKKEKKGEEMNVDVGSSCCLLHFLWDCADERKLGEDLKRKRSSSFFKTFLRKNALLMKKIMENRFSKEFVDFLCICLSFKSQSKVVLSENLLNHPFFTLLQSKKNDVCLQEITKIATNWNSNQSKDSAKNKLIEILQSISIVLEEKKIKRSNFFEKKNIEKLAFEISGFLGTGMQTTFEIIKSLQFNNF